MRNFLAKRRFKKDMIMPDYDSMPRTYRFNTNQTWSCSMTCYYFGEDGEVISTWTTI